MTRALARGAMAVPRVVLGAVWALAAWGFTMFIGTWTTAAALRNAYGLSWTAAISSVIVGRIPHDSHFEAGPCDSQPDA
jgi:hypothetical protein